MYVSSYTGNIAECINSVEMVTIGKKETMINYGGNKVRLIIPQNENTGHKTNFI
jgi:hypothetical protein